MKNFGKKIYWLLLPALTLVLFDEFIKVFALKNFPDEQMLTGRDFISLGIHKNWGLAFDIPFRLELILLISVVIGYFLIRIARENFSKHPNLSFASMLILVGALGNVFDRVVYGFTVDYVIFFGRSAINISDLLILCGVILLLLASRKTKNRVIMHTEEQGKI